MSNAKNLYTGVLLLLSLLLLFVHQWRSQPPQPLGIDAATSEFSAGRASKILNGLLSEQVPHPVGSRANLVVRQNIEAQLTKLGIRYRIQQTWGCNHRRNLCAPVDNIIATIEGTEGQSSIALMAHYDSVPTSLGVGDDGLAVAAILETARALSLKRNFKHDALFVFTDGEEAGLLGAEAFYRDAPEAQQVDVVLNYEGGGSAGVSRLLRSSDNSQQLVKAFTHTAKYPIGNSLSIEIFARMPNDTDFSVALRHGKQGLDFALAEERAHYHTVNDNLDSLNLESLQHHGENMLPVVQYLLNHFEPNQLAEPLVYIDIYGYWFSWPINWQLPICLAITLLFLVVVLKPFSIDRVTQIGRGIFLATIVLLASMIAGFVVLKLLDIYHNGLPAWPADPMGFRLSVVAATLSAGLTATILLPRGNQDDTFLGAWTIMLALTIGCAVWLPNAANTFLLAVGPGVCLIILARFLSNTLKPWIHGATLIMLIPITLGFYYPIESSQGYRLGIALLPFLAMFAMVFAALTTHRGQAPIALGALLVAIAGLLYAFVQPLYSNHRLQQVNLYQLFNLDSQQGYVSLSSNNAAPASLLAAGNFETTKKPLLPYSTYETKHWRQHNESWAEDPLAGLTARVEQQNNLRVVELRLRTTELDSEFRLYWAADIPLKRYLIDGSAYAEPIPPEARNFNSLTLYGVNNREVKLTLEFENEGPVPTYLVMVRHQLPTSLQDLVEVRNQALATPVHQGDQALLFRHSIL